MSSTFPSILTSYTDPLATNRLNAPSHSGIESNQNSGLKQLEAVIGVAGSASVVGTYEYFIKSPASNGGGHVQTANTGGTGQTGYTKGDLIIASSSSVLGKQAIGADGQILIADSTQALGARWGGGKFGGTGADGALAISAGTTTINLSSVQTLVKNYTSISITGTGKLAFSSPHANGTVVILKSQGGVTITSSTGSVISLVGIGGNTAAPGYSYSILKTFNGITAGGGGGAGGAGSIAAVAINTINTSILVAKYPNVLPGAGGGTAGAVGGGGGGGSYRAAGSDGNNGANTGSTTPGVGARGGGSLVIECGGNFNFTSSNSGITVAGANGTNGGGANDGGGGGGGGGVAIIAVASIVANTGTIETNGGNGGTHSGSGGDGGSGAAGYSLVMTNTDFL